MTANRDQTGSAAVELAVLAPVVILLMLAAVAAGRLVVTGQNLDAAAAAAARAASQQPDPDTARTAAGLAATAALAAAPAACRQPDVTINTDNFAAGGTVTVGLACTADLSGLALLHLPGRRTLHARAAAPIDTYRTVTQP